MGFMLICITIGRHEHEFSQISPKLWIAVKYTFRHILLIISTCNLKLFGKQPISMGYIMWKLKDHSYSSKWAILLQSWHFWYPEKNSILCNKRMLVSRYIAHSVCCDVILVAISRFLGWQTTGGNCHWKVDTMLVTWTFKMDPKQVIILRFFPP